MSVGPRSSRPVSASSMVSPAKHRTVPPKPAGLPCHGLGRDRGQAGLVSMSEDSDVAVLEDGESGTGVGATGTGGRAGWLAILGPRAVDAAGVREGRTGLVLPVAG
jgi:hypothetical protein